MKVASRMCCCQAGGACAACESRLVALWAVRDELHHMLCRRGSPPEVAHDAVAETFAVVWCRLQDLPDDDTGARAWMFTTAKHVMANMRRRQEHQRAVARSVAAQPPQASPDPVCERMAALEAFGSLSREDRALLRIVARTEPSMAELADCLHCSTTAAATRLSRARSRLARALHSEHEGRVVA